MLNDWFSTIDEICADNYNYFQFKLKGKFHCDAAAADGVERLQEITAYLLVWCDGGKLRSMAEIICSLIHAVCTTAPRKDFTAGTFLFSLTFLILVSYAPSAMSCSRLTTFHRR